MADNHHFALAQAASRLRCVECGAVSDKTARGWCAYLGGGFDEDDDPIEVGVFCPACVQREFMAD
jgi:ribosomal protein S27AE